MSTHPESGASDGEQSYPLTFGQLSVWRGIEPLPRRRWHEANNLEQLDLPQPVSIHRLKQALKRVDAKHESLRTVYDLSDPRQPQQRLLPPTENPPLEVVPAGSATVDELRRTSLHRPFDIRVDRQMRVLAISTSADTSDEAFTDRLLVCEHHMSMDAWSFLLLKQDLLAMLRCGGQEVPPAPDSLITIAREQRTSTLWRTRQEAAQRHFRQVYLQDTAEFDDQADGHGGLHAILESKALHRAAYTLAQRYTVSVATVLTAAYADALAACSTGQLLRIYLMSSNRFAERWDNLITSMNQTVPTMVAADTTEEFGARLMNLQQITMRAYRLGIYNVDEFTPSALGITRSPEQIRPMAGLNFISPSKALYDDEEIGDVAPPVHWQEVFTTYDSRCYLRVFDTDDGTIRLQIFTNGLSRGTVIGLLNRIYQVVTTNAANPVPVPE